MLSSRFNKTWFFYSFPITLLIALVTLDAGVGHAFSLGKIRVTGAFESPFRAEIPVRSNGMEGLQAWLGDENDYRKMGLERPAIIDTLSLEVADHPIHSDQKIIYITGTEPISQPSFNLAIKAALGSGVILENYFLALDFQKNLSLEAPTTKEEREEMKKVASELEALRPGADKKIVDQEQAAVVEGAELMSELDKIRAEEEIAEAKRNNRNADKPAAVVKKKSVTMKEPAVVEREITSVDIETAYIDPKPAAQTAKQETAPQKKASDVMAIALSSDPAKNRYDVVGGDTLYQVAKKLGATDKDLDRVVVALWKDNKEHFIDGNIHGLLKGRTLDFSSVNETFHNTTHEEANKVIMGQWPEWQAFRRSLKPAPVMKAKAAPADRPAKKAAGGDLTVEPVGLEMSAEEQASLADESAPEETQSHPYVLHVASFKKRDDARELVSLLRSKGVSAFEVLSSIANKGEWYRVVTNRFDSPAEAEEFSEKIGKLGVSRYTRILNLPYAIQIGADIGQAEAKTKLDELYKAGISAYSMDSGREGYVRLYSGAFESAASADLAMDSLPQIGIRYSVVQP